MSKYCDVDYCEVLGLTNIIRKSCEQINTQNVNQSHDYERRFFHNKMITVTG